MKIKRIVVGPIQTNCYILTDNGMAAVIDPGGRASTISQAIEEESERLDLIINTHYHFDHTLANKKLKAKYGAEIIIHEAEKPYLKFEADQYVRDGEGIAIGKEKLKIIHTPGHTPGSFCLVGDKIIFTGDTLFYDGYGRTDLAGGSEEDIQESLKKLEKIIMPGTMVYPGHGEVFVKEK